MSFHVVKLLDNEAIYEDTYTVEFELYVDGVLTAPSSATLSMWTPGNTQKVTDAACTINNTTKRISYTVTSTLMENLEEDYRLQLSYVVSSVTYKDNRLFDVVRFKIKCDVVDKDLEPVHPDLAGDLWNGKTTYATQIEEAFRRVKEDIKNFGNRPHLMVDGSQVKDLVIHKALAIIFEDFAKSPDDIWEFRAKRENERYTALLGRVELRMDTDEDKVIDTKKRFNTIHLVR